MYLKHFGITKHPFSLTPDTRFYCNLSTHQAAYNTLLFSLKSGEGFIKIIGEVGSGKTLLCRKLLDALGDKFYTAYIPNPDLSPDNLRLMLAKELEVPIDDAVNQVELFQAILKRLFQLHEAGQRVILIVDEAQALPDDSLEALRLLTNLETRTQKLLQIVLFAQPELDVRLQKHHFRQLNQRITFSHDLTPITRHDLEAYLCHRLAMAGYTKGHFFHPKACHLLYKASKGIPRIINVLSHKAMLVAYGKGDRRISAKAVKLAIKDSHLMTTSKRKRLFDIFFYIGLGCIILAAIAFRLGYLGFKA